MKISSRKIVVTGMLAAIAIILGATGFGMIPIPGPAGRATIMHVPAILGGILEGPVVGAFVGLLFGLYSFLNPTSLSADPLVSVFPRIFIGIFSYLVYNALKRHKTVGPAVAAIVGTLTNTIGFLGMAVLRGYLNWQAVVAIIITNTIGEVIVAVIIVVILVRALTRHKLQN